MKRNICLTLLICMMAFGLNAQINYSYTTYQNNGSRRYLSKPESINKYRKFNDVRVKEVTQTYFRKEKPSFIINYKYNLSSRIYEIDSKDVKNKGALTIFNYKNDTLLLSIYQITKNKDTSTAELFSYNNNNKCTEELELREGQTYHLCKYEWNENGLVKRIENTYAKHRKWNSTTEIDYYDDKSKKEERVFKNGKLKHKYVYACSPVGEKVQLDKEESKVCTIKNKNDDGSFYYIYETTEGKKGIRRNIQKFNPDSMMTSYEIYDLEGGLKFKYEYHYENKKLVREDLFGVHKRYSSAHFIYGSDDLLSSSYSKNKRGKKIRDYRYTCTKYE
jgi:hypothetical protein